MGSSDSGPTATRSARAKVGAARGLGGFGKDRSRAESRGRWVTAGDAYGTPVAGTGLAAGNREPPQAAEPGAPTGRPWETREAMAAR
jgi:hypothetical protein